MDYTKDLLLDNLAVLAIVSFVFVITLGLLYIVGLGCSCFKKKGKHTLNPLAYLKNMDLVKKNLEESFYFSEILSSSGDNCSRGGSLVSMRSDSTVSVISETGTNFELLPVVNSVFSSCAELHMPSTSATLPPTVTIGVKFLPYGSDKSKECGKLFVIIIDIHSLPFKEYPRHAETYVTLNILRSSKIFVSGGKKQNIVYANCSRSIRNARNITLNEHFVLDAQKSELQKWNLRITVFIRDMYTEPIELASSMVSLSQVYKQLIANTEGTEMTINLKPTQKVLGNLLVGLSYLPTSQRLTVSIVKASNLKQISKDKNRRKNFHPYAQLFLLMGAAGRQLKKKRLFFEQTTDVYDFNSTVSFDVSPSQLQNITLLLVLYNKNSDIVDAEHGSSNPDKTSHDQYLGRIAIGNLVTGVKEKKHWRMMLSVPRRVVTVWHTLK